MHVIFRNLFIIVSIFCGLASAEAHERIITLAPVLSEWTAELLGQKDTELKLIGVSEYSNYPAYLAKFPTIGSYMKLNSEKIAELKPDLVIASSIYNRPEQLEQLKRLKIPVEILPAEKFSEMPGWIKRLGEILGTEKQAALVSARWSEEVKVLARKKTNPPKSFFLEVQHVPLVTIGSESFLNDALATVGFQNIFQSLPQAYPKVSIEAVLKLHPDQIFIMDLSGIPDDFTPAKAAWGKFGRHPRLISGNDFARCSFSLLAGLRGLSQ